MPVLSDFTELSTEGMNIDAVRWRGEVIRKSLGSGFGVAARVGPASGLHGFVLSSGCLPDDPAMSPIDGVSRFEYYYEHFKEHTTGDQEVFVIEWRGDKYHVSYAQTDISYERFTDDLFAGGVELVPRRVRGMTYQANGSIFDPSIVAGVWSWHNETYTEDEGEYLIADQTGNGRNFEIAGVNIVPTADIQNGRSVYRFNAGATNDGFLSTALDPTIYEAFIVMQMREAAFSNFAGILTDDNTGAIAALLGDSGTTKFFDLSIPNYTYKLNGVEYAANDQQAPMQAFGVVHIKMLGGAVLTNLQIGKDRAAGDRFAEMDLAEIVLCDEVLSATDSEKMTEYLMRRWNITA